MKQTTRDRCQTEKDGCLPNIIAVETINEDISAQIQEVNSRCRDRHLVGSRDSRPKRTGAFLGPLEQPAGEPRKEEVGRAPSGKDLGIAPDRGEEKSQI